MTERVCVPSAHCHSACPCCTRDVCSVEHLCACAGAECGSAWHLGSVRRRAGAAGHRAGRPFLGVGRLSGGPAASGEGRAPRGVPQASCPVRLPLSFGSKADLIGMRGIVHRGLATPCTAASSSVSERMHRQRSVHKLECPGSTHVIRARPSVRLCGARGAQSPGPALAGAGGAAHAGGAPRPGLTAGAWRDALLACQARPATLPVLQTGLANWVTGMKPSILKHSPVCCGRSKYAAAPKDAIVHIEIHEVRTFLCLMPNYHSSQEINFCESLELERQPVER